MNGQVAERVDEGIEGPPDAEDVDGADEDDRKGRRTLDDIIDTYSDS